MTICAFFIFISAFGIKYEEKRGKRIKKKMENNGNKTDNTENFFGFYYLGFYAIKSIFIDIFFFCSSKNRHIKMGIK